MLDSRSWFSNISSVNNLEMAAVGGIAGGVIGIYLSHKITKWIDKRDKEIFAKHLRCLPNNKFKVNIDVGYGESIENDITCYFYDTKIIDNLSKALDECKTGLSIEFVKLIKQQALPKIYQLNNETWLQFIPLWEAEEFTLPIKPTSQSENAFLIARFDAYFKAKGENFDKYYGMMIILLNIITIFRDTIADIILRSITDDTEQYLLDIGTAMQLYLNILQESEPFHEHGFHETKRRKHTIIGLYDDVNNIIKEAIQLQKQILAVNESKRAYEANSTQMDRAMQFLLRITDNTAANCNQNNLSRAFIEKGITDVNPWTTKGYYYYPENALFPQLVKQHAQAGRYYAQSDTNAMGTQEIQSDKFRNWINLGGSKPFFIRRNEKEYTITLPNFARCQGKPAYVNSNDKNQYLHDLGTEFYCNKLKNMAADVDRYLRYMNAISAMWLDLMIRLDKSGWENLSKQGELDFRIKVIDATHNRAITIFKEKILKNEYVRLYLKKSVNPCVIRNALEDIISISTQVGEIARSKINTVAEHVLGEKKFSDKVTYLSKPDLNIWRAEIRYGTPYPFNTEIDQNNMYGLPYNQMEHFNCLKGHAYYHQDVMNKIRYFKKLSFQYFTGTPTLNLKLEDTQNIALFVKNDKILNDYIHDVFLGSDNKGNFHYQKFAKNETEKSTDELSLIESLNNFDKIEYNINKCSKHLVLLKKNLTDIMVTRRIIRDNSKNNTGILVIDLIDKINSLRSDYLSCNIVTGEIIYNNEMLFNKEAVLEFQSELDRLFIFISHYMIEEKYLTINLKSILTEIRAAFTQAKSAIDTIGKYFNLTFQEMQCLQSKKQQLHYNKRVNQLEVEFQNEIAVINKATYINNTNMLEMLKQAFDETNHIYISTTSLVTNFQNSINLLLDKIDILTKNQVQDEFKRIESCILSCNKDHLDYLHIIKIKLHQLDRLFSLHDSQQHKNTDFIEITTEYKNKLDASRKVIENSYAGIFTYINTKLDKMTEEIAKLKSQQLMLENEKDNVIIENTSITVTLNTTTDLNATLNNQVESLNQIIFFHQEKQKEIIATAKKMKAIINEGVANTLKNKNYTDAKDKIKNLLETDAYSRSLRDVTEAHVELQFLIATLAKVEIDYSTLSSSIDKLLESELSNEIKIDEISKNANDIKGTIAKEKKELIKLKEQITLLQDRVHSLQEENVRVLKDRIEHMKESQNELMKAKDSLETSINNQMEQLKDQVKYLMDSITIYKTMNDKNSAEINMLKNENMQQRNEFLLKEKMFYKNINEIEKNLDVSKSAVKKLKAEKENELLVLNQQYAAHKNMLTELINKQKNKILQLQNKKRSIGLKVSVQKMSDNRAENMNQINHSWLLKNANGKKYELSIDDVNEKLTGMRWIGNIENIVKKIKDYHASRYKNYDKLRYFTIAYDLCMQAIYSGTVDEIKLRFKIFLICCLQNKDGNGFFNRKATATGLSILSHLYLNNPLCQYLRNELFNDDSALSYKQLANKLWADNAAKVHACELINSNSIAKSETMTLEQWHYSRP